jgi:hypothetical protein
VSGPLFSVIIPTIGRPTLPRTLESIREQDSWADIVIVADTHGPLLTDARAVADEYRARYFELDAGRHDTGSSQIAYGMGLAHGRWLLVPGDDDVYTLGAFDVIRAAIDAQSDPCPLMFRAELHPAPQRGSQSEPILFPRERRIVEGAVTGQCFVCPNDPSRLGRWGTDWQFMRETVALYGGRVEWRDELIVRCF